MVELGHESGFGASWRSFPACWMPSRAGTGRKGSPGDHQVSQRKEAVQLRCVLGESAVTDLPMLEEILDDMKRMFDTGAHLGFEFLKLLREVLNKTLGHRFDLAALGGHMPLDAQAAGRNLLP